MVKEYIVDVWEIRKHKLYDSDSGSSLQLHTQSSPGERNGKFSQNGKFGQNGKFSQNGRFGQNGMSGQKGKVHLGPNVSSSAHYRGCVVNGSNMSIINPRRAIAARVTVVVSCVCLYVCPHTLFWQYARLKSITKDAIVLSVRFAAILKRRFSLNCLIRKLERLLLTSAGAAIFS